MGGNLPWNFENGSNWRKVRITAIFRKVVTFNIDITSRDGNLTHQIAFRSCDSNFVRKTIEIERTKNLRRPNRTYASSF